MCFTCLNSNSTLSPFTKLPHKQALCVLLELLLETYMCWNDSGGRASPKVSSATLGTSNESDITFFFSSANDKRIETWHARLGHASISMLKHILCIPFDNFNKADLPLCEACHLGKQ